MTLLSTFVRRLCEAKKAGAYYDPKGAGIRTTHWFWGASKKIAQAIDQNQIANPQAKPEIGEAKIDPEQKLNDIVLKTPQISGASLINAMKAEGLKVVHVNEANYFKQVAAKLKGLHEACGKCEEPKEIGRAHV